jgi:hypothetical protein
MIAQILNQSLGHLNLTEDKDGQDLGIAIEDQID